MTSDRVEARRRARGAYGPGTAPGSGEGRHPALPSRRGLLRHRRRFLIALGAVAATTLAFFPGFANRTGLAGAGPMTAGARVTEGASLAPAAATTGATTTIPASLARCSGCLAPADEAAWTALLDFAREQPPGETAFLASAGTWRSLSSHTRLAHDLPEHTVLGLSLDPASPHGYRFVGGTEGPEGPATRSVVPAGVRLLVLPDPELAGLLDPRHFRVELRPTATGDSVSVARIHGGSTLELVRHRDHAHVALRRAERSPVDPLPPLRVEETELLSPVTGPASPNDAARWDLFASDLGHAFWHDDRLHLVFGDSFGRGGRWSGRNWRSNAMAVLAPTGPAPESLRFESMVTGGFGWAREILPSRKIDHVEMTVLPTSGTSIESRMFLHYQSVQHWIESGSWIVGHAGIAYSDDGGHHWIRPESARWPGRIGFEQAALVRHEGMVYAFGTPAGRSGPVRLRRVPERQILEAAAWEYWDGTDWGAVPAQAVPLFPGPAGQVSVAWNPRHRVWMMMYLDPARDAIVLRLAPRLTGPWDEPRVAVRGLGEYPGLYEPYIVPLPETGELVWFTMSRWWPYNVFLMRMTLAEEPRALASSADALEPRAGRSPDR